MPIKKRWELSATPDEVKMIRMLDKQLDDLKAQLKELSWQRLQITNRCNSRTIGRGL